METWTVIADEQQASLLVSSSYGPFYEIETWKRQGQSPEHFAHEITSRLGELQTHYDQWVLAAPPAVLDRLGRAMSASLRGKLSAQHPRYLTHLTQRELGQELRQLCPA